MSSPPPGDNTPVTGSGAAATPPPTDNNQIINPSLRLESDVTVSPEESDVTALLTLSEISHLESEGLSLSRRTSERHVLPKLQLGGSLEIAFLIFMFVAITEFEKI